MQIQEQHNVLPSDMCVRETLGLTAGPEEQSNKGITESISLRNGQCLRQRACLVVVNLTLRWGVAYVSTIAASMIP